MSAPMNMEEWQRKLKAEKDAARQKKSESAEILHGYRGDLNDDELKLKAIRDEERKKAQDAQQILHNYKGSNVPDGGTTKSKEQQQQQQQHFPIPVNAGQGTQHHRDGVLDAIVMGSVSERAAALAAAAAAEGTLSVPIPTTSVSTRSSSKNTGSADASTAAVATTASSNNDTPSSVPAVDDDDEDDDDDYGPSIQTNANISSMDNSTAFQSSPPSLPPPIQNHPVISTTTTATNDTPIVVQSDMSQPAQPPVLVPTPIEESVLVEIPSQTVIAPTNDAISAVTTTTVAEDIAIIPTSQQQQQRIDVLLAFGLVTISSPPNLDSYINALQTIAIQSIPTTTADGNIVVNATMDPHCPPYVKEMKWDESYVSRSGRVDVKRLVVTVAVPIFVPADIPQPLKKECIAKTKGTIANVLQQAIASGDFLSHATPS